MKEIQLKIDSINHKVGKNIILDNVNLKLIGQQSITLLGPNGAGKSTIMKAMAAHLYCQSGRIKLNGIDSEYDRLDYLKLIGYMSENPLIISELTVLEQLQFMSQIKHIKNPKYRIESVVELCQLQNVLCKRSKYLSLGYKQRLNLAQALLNEPFLLIMDEPLNGLDPHLIIKFRDIINELKKTTLIVVSTHYLAEAQKISDRIIIMQNGKVLDNIKMDLASNHNNIEDIYMQHTNPSELIL